MKRSMMLAASAAVLALALPATAQAAERFWVSNQSDYEIHDVFAAQDTSGGEHDLMGPNGVIPSWDQARTLIPHVRGCYTDVAVVNEYDQWVWFWDVNVCTPGNRVEVYNRDFFD